MSLPAPSFLNSSRVAMAAVLALLLASCSGGGDAPAPQPSAPVNPLAMFTQQKLDWQACNPDLFDADIRAVGARLTCTSMRAPLDYNNPALGELSVALMRASAEQPQQRLGAIAFNTGGPGEDGLLYGAYLASLFAKANPADPAGKLLKDMSNRYDMIGFSPRGVGASTSLSCTSSYLLQPEYNSTFDRSPENIQNKQSNERLKAETCAKNPLTKHIHTDATARDMDLMRGLLGDEKLNYIGYSYGTWLGTWYASLFPERVGRMLLDSSMNVTGTFDDAKLLSVVGRQRVMDEIIFPFAARNDKLFNLGDNAGLIRSRVLALSPVLKDVVITSSRLNDPKEFEENSYLLTAAVGLQALRDKMPGADQRSISAAIETYPFTAEPGNAKAVNFALQFNTFFYTQPKRPPVSLGASDSTYLSVICNDLATTGDAQYWAAVGNEYAKQYPLTGGSISNVCVYWGAPYGMRPPLANAAKAGPLLMLQSRYDAPTPIEGALKTLGALPNASMIVVENEYKHTLFPYDGGCVDAQVAGYFVNGVMPPRTTSCPGKLLPAGAFVATTPQSSSKAGVEPPSKAYTDPAKAAELMQRIHQRRGDGALKF